MDATLERKVAELAREIAGNAKTIADVNGVIQLMLKSALERMLDTEMDVHLGRRGACIEEAPENRPLGQEPPEGAAGDKRPANRRNGRSSKLVQGELGEFEIETPRDRLGTFEPQLIEKYQRRVEGFDQKILKLYAKGMTTRDIQEIVKELYGVDVSATLVSEITADLDAEVTAWRTRPLDPVWPRRRKGDILLFKHRRENEHGNGPRTARHSVGGMYYHVLNRGNARAEVFHKDADYGAFLKLLREANERVSMRLLAWCLLPNHFHLVAWPREDENLTRGCNA